MSKKIKVTSKALKKVKVSSPTLPRLEPDKLSAAFGVELEPQQQIAPQSPLSLFALRQEIARRLTSTGGRPALDGTTRRQKIPMANGDWDQLCELAELLGDDENSPTPGQIAGVLLHQALSSLNSAQNQTELKAQLKRAQRTT